MLLKDGRRCIIVDNYIGGMIMDQNTIAIIWDFDKTLIQGYMQEPIFKKFNIDDTEFWKEVNALPETYAKKGIKVNKETIYLNHMITCVNQGIFPGLNNDMLFELGKELVFYPGVPEVFRLLTERIAGFEKYQKFGIHVEHYIVSTGLTTMIKGSVVNEFVKGIWGCEFIEEPIRSNLDIKLNEKNEGDRIETIRQIGYIIDNTSKTRAVFEINKGTNVFEDIDVNGKISNDDRRVPFENMIYIADGPSDVPVFSVLKQYGGKTFAIYPKGDSKAFRQVDGLREDGRIDMYAEANYEKNTTAYMWLERTALDIADRIYSNHLEQIKRSVSQPPRHITD